VGHRWFPRALWRVRPPVLALGGGGARGFAHLGLLEVLELEGLEVRAIAGTSAGAIMGAMYLALGSTRAMHERWREAFEKDLVKSVSGIGQPRHGEGQEEHPLLRAARTIRDRVVISLAVNRSTILDGEELERAVEFLIPDVAIEDLPRPFVAVATDLVTGEEVRMDRGSLRRAVLASSSIPALVPPVEWGGRPLVDGGVVVEVPVGAARALGRPVVAVDISMDLPPYRPDRLVLETMSRTQMMTATLLRRYQLRGASRVIRPAVGGYSWSTWDHWPEILEAGRRAGLDLVGR